MARDERQTRIELINSILNERGWTDALIHEERTPGGTNIIDGKPRKTPLAVAILEAKMRQAADNQLEAIEALPGAILQVAFDFEEEEAS